MKNTLKKITIDGKMIRRLIMTVVGIYLTAVSVAIFRKALLGVDPFTVLVEAMENVSGYRYGIVFPAVQVVLLLITFIFGRKYINFGTLLTLFCIGFLVDKTSIVMNYILPNPNLSQRIITLIIGLILVCFAGSLYMTANLGVSAYDAMFALKQDDVENESILEICQYINWHMYPYNIKLEKTKNRFIDFVGQEFYDNLMILHEADKNAH